MQSLSRRSSPPIYLARGVLPQLPLDPLHPGAADLVHVADGQGGEGDLPDRGRVGVERDQDRGAVPLLHDLRWRTNGGKL